MSTYQVLLHGSGFDAALDGESGAIAGFFTARRVRADGPDEAFLVALEQLKSEPLTKSLLNESLSNGSTPSFEAEQVFEISFWARIFKRSPKGFIFYDGTEE